MNTSKLSRTRKELLYRDSIPSGRYTGGKTHYVLIAPDRADEKLTGLLGQRNKRDIFRQPGIAIVEPISTAVNGMERTWLLRASRTVTSDQVERLLLHQWCDTSPRLRIELTGGASALMGCSSERMPCLGEDMGAVKKALILRVRKG